MFIIFNMEYKIGYNENNMLSLSNIFSSNMVILKIIFSMWGIVCVYLYCVFDVNNIMLFGFGVMVVINVKV